MAAAMPAYRSRERARRARANVRVVRGRKPEGLSARTVALARVFMVLVVLFAAVGCVRIAFTAATVNTAMATEQLSAEVRNLQSYGANLEVKESSLANPAQVRSKAAGLGMAAPATTEVISLGEDAVAVDQEGNLSLSQSLANIAED